MIRTPLSVCIIKVEPKINDGKWYHLKKIAVPKSHGLWVHHVIKQNGAKILSALTCTPLSVGIIKVEPKINDGKWYHLTKIAVTKYHDLWVHHFIEQNGAKILSSLIRTPLCVSLIKVEPKIDDWKWYDLNENSSSQIS